MKKDRYNKHSVLLKNEDDLYEELDEEGLDYIDVLKIDVEGAEQEIFESVSFASIAPMIHIIIGEYHNYDPIPILQTLGFRVYVDHHHSKFTARRI